jgi:gliding motility-associated-like protein
MFFGQLRFSMRKYVLPVFLLAISWVFNTTVHAQSSTYTQAICSGDDILNYTDPGFTVGETYNWPVPAVLPGGSVSNATAGTAQADFNQIALNNNTNTIQATVTYSITTSLGRTFTLVVTVNPKPSVTNQTTSVCSGSLFTLTPINVPANTKYSWVAPNDPGNKVNGDNAQGTPQLFIAGQTLTNSTTSPATIIYTIDPIAGACVGNSFLVTVTVNPLPVLSNAGAAPVAVCSGTSYGYTPASATPGTSFNWTRNTFTGVSNSGNSGTNNPNEILFNSTTGASTAPVNIFYTFTLSANGCSNPQTINTTVNPSPVLTSPTNPSAICSGSNFNYTPAAIYANSPSFTWTRFSNPTINGGLTNSSPPSVINETLTNSSTTLTNYATYSYTITDGVTGCVSTTGQFVSVPVSVAPNITNKTVSVCSGNTFYTDITNVPDETTYTWTAALTGGAVSGFSTVGAGQFFVGAGQTLTGAGTVDYTVTPSNNTCQGTIFHVIVTVTAGSVIPLITNAPANICSGSTVTFTSPASAASSPTYDWKRFYTPGISPNVNSGTNTSNPNEILNAPTYAGSSYTAYYAFITHDVSGCYATQIIPVTIAPKPALITANTIPNVCDGQAATYTPLSSVLNTTFTWSRVAIGTNPASSGAGNLSEVLVNTTAVPLNVTYVYTLLNNGCTNNVNVTTSVNPTPKLSSTLTPAAVCSGATFAYNPTSATASTSFTWTRAQVTSISNGTGAGAGNPGEVLVNTGITAVAVPYVYTLLANGCTGSETVSVNVNPAPNVAAQTANSCSGSSFTVNPSNVPTGTQYAWGLPVYAPLASINGATTGASSTTGITQTLNNTTGSPAVATYTVTPTANGCAGSPFILTVNVSTLPTLTSSLLPPDICGNAVFSYVPTGAVAGTSFSWSRNTISGISNSAASGTNNPNETLVNTGNSAVPVSYIYFINTPDGCVNNQTVVVNVKALPKFTSATPASAICSGTIFNYAAASSIGGTTYSWSRPSTAGIANSAASGSSSNPGETLVNATINTVTVSYAFTLQANGCFNNQTLNVDIKPTPAIADQLASSCDNTAFNISPSNVPVGTVYTWTTPTSSPGGSLAGGNSQAIGQSTISGTLDNITSAPANAVYTVIPAANSCTGNSFLLTVTVNTATTLSSSLTPPAVCSNNAFAYNPTSATPGTSFSWTRAIVTGISNAAASGTGNPNESLINITPNPVTVTYIYAMNTPNSCQNTQTVNVIVNPSPILSSTLTPPDICSGYSFNYTPTSATSGVAYTWTRSVLPSISNGPGAGSGPVNPSELLVNTTVNPVTVAYSYTLTANSCVNNQTVNVIVNPTPKVLNQTATICGNTVFNINPLNIPAGTKYTWVLPSSNPAGSVGGMSAQAVAQNNIGQTLTNATVNPAVANYTITPETNGCVGSAFSAAVTVQPAPVIADQLLAAVCSGVAFNYTASNVPAGTTYTWSTPILGPVNGLIGGSAQSLNQNNINQTLNSSNNIMDTATYTVTPSTAGCTGNTFKLIVPVKPIAILAGMRDTICTGGTFGVSPVNVPLNTTYTWTAPVSIPFGAISGGTARTVPAQAVSQTLFNGSNAISEIAYTIIPNTNGCDGPAFVLRETVGIPLAIVPNATATICSGTRFDVTPTTSPPLTTYTWTTPTINPTTAVSGYSGQAGRQTIINQLLSNNTNSIRSVVYTVTPFNTGCYGTPFTATINVRPVPKPTLNARPVVCRYPLDTLTVDLVGQGPWSFDYTDNGVTGRISNITSTPYTWVVNAIPNLPTRSFEITRVYDYACVDSTDTARFVQKINPLPVGQIVSMHGTYICHGIPDTMFVSYNPALDTLRFQWTRNGANLTGATVDSISTVTAGRYNSILTNQYGCVDTAAVSAVLIAVPKPVLNFSVDAMCINTLLHFSNLTDTNFTGPINWVWDMGNNTFQNAYHSTATYNKAGSRHIKLTANQVYCPLYPTSMDSTIEIQFPIPAVRLPSVSAYSNQTTPLTGRSFPNYKYQWLPSRGIDFPTVSSPNFNYQTTQDYVINLISPAGCVTPDSMLVRVFDENLVNIMVPKSFTPNGDGVNDILYPYLAGVKTFSYFKVFNRFGQLMFTSTDPDKGWNGTMNGTQQPMAIYIWVAVGIANDGTPVEKRGEVLLLR